MINQRPCLESCPMCHYRPQRIRLPGLFLQIGLLSTIAAIKTFPIVYVYCCSLNLRLSNQPQRLTRPMWVWCPLWGGGIKKDSISYFNKVDNSFLNCLWYIRGSHHSIIIILAMNKYFFIILDIREPIAISANEGSLISGFIIQFVGLNCNTLIRKHCFNHEQKCCNSWYAHDWTILVN